MFPVRRPSGVYPPADRPVNGCLQASTLLLTDLLSGANAMACTTSASRHSRPERIKGASTTWPATHLEELDGPSTSRQAHSPAERAPVRQTWWWFPSQSMGPSVSVPCQSAGPSVSVPCQSVGPSVSQSVGPSVSVFLSVSGAISQSVGRSVSVLCQSVGPSVSQWGSQSVGPSVSVPFQSVGPSVSGTVSQCAVSVSGAVSQSVGPSVSQWGCQSVSQCGRQSVSQ